MRMPDGVYQGHSKVIDMQKLFVGAVLVLALAGCATEQTKPTVAVAPPAPPATIMLDDGDKAIVDQTLASTAKMPAGQVVSWNNPASGRSGKVTVIRQGYSRQGRLCQEFHLVAVEGPVRRQQVGTACADGSGQWKPDGGYALTSTPASS